MFQLTRQESEVLRYRFGTLKTGRGQHRKYLPFVFTEHGAIMAANVLNSREAVQMSVFVVRAFLKMRALLGDKREWAKILAALEKELTGESSVDFEAAQPRLHVNDDQRESGRRMLEEAGISNDSSPILTLSPGATNSRAKRWLAERFASTADRLAERNGFQTLIVGTTGDIEVANEVAARMRTNALVLAGRTSIAELKAILACTSLVISNDTGTAHVSAALGVPTVVVFGPTEHFSTRPLSDAATVVRHEVECSPCMLRECPIDHRCMTRIEIDDVYFAAQSLLISASR